MLVLPIMAVEMFLKISLSPLKKEKFCVFLDQMVREKLP